MSIIPFKARYIRIYPLAWHGPLPTLRAELFGKACNSWKCMDAAVGVSSGIISDTSMCATSAHRAHNDASHARLFGSGSWQSDRMRTPNVQQTADTKAPVVWKVDESRNGGLDCESVCRYNMMRCAEEEFTAGTSREGVSKVATLASAKCDSISNSKTSSSSPAIYASYRRQLERTTSECVYKCTGCSGSKLRKCNSRPAGLLLQHRPRARSSPWQPRWQPRWRGAPKSLRRICPCQSSTVTRRRRDTAPTPAPTAVFTNFITQSGGEWKFTDEGLKRQQKMYYDHFKTATNCASLDKDPNFQNSADGYQKREQRDYEDNEVFFSARHQFLEIRIGQHTVTAVATQGDTTLKQYVQAYKLSYQEHVNAPWQFYTAGTTTGANTIVDATTLAGNTDSTSVKKNFIKPFVASAIRFHPIHWTGVSMSLRVEAFTCLTKFDWTPVGKFTNTRGASQSMCGALTNNEDVQASFDSWTLGRGGSGAIYQSTPHEVAVRHDDNVNEEDDDTIIEHLKAENTKLVKEAAAAKQAEADRSATVAATIERLKSENTKLIKELGAARQAEADHSAAVKDSKDDGAFGLDAIEPLRSKNTSLVKLIRLQTVLCSKVKLIRLKHEAELLPAKVDAPTVLGESSKRPNVKDVTTSSEKQSSTKTLLFQAYQQRTVTGGGLMTKQLICFQEKGLSDTKQCCVQKSSKKFSGTTWSDQELRTLLA